MSNASKHWLAIARQWEQVGSPLRPAAQDLAFYGDALERCARERDATRGLILGVTPELYRLPWPQQRPLAIDHTQAMIDALWPGSPGSAICAEWTAIPQMAGPRDIVMCDGGLHLLAYPQAQSAMLAAVRDIIVPGGWCVFRFFMPPAQHESAAAVIDDLLAGRIANLNLLKLRLGTALQRDAATGVALRDVWNTLNAAAPDFEQFAARLRWPLPHLLAINTYRDSSDRYYFVTFDEIRELFGAQGFEIISTGVPTYELGERCPTVAFRRA